MAWSLVPSLVSLRAEFDTLAPSRGRASDGAIGDARHQASSSDHNIDDTPGWRTPSSDADNTPEVHAIDVDKDLNRAGWSMERAVQIIVLRHRQGRDDRLQNCIWNGKIWSRSWGWTARTYTGANTHTQHAHFSARYTTAQERDTRPWGLLDAARPAKPAPPPPEEFIMATREDVKQAVLEALEEVRPYTAAGPRKRLQDDRKAAGLTPWSNQSVRSLLEYLFDANVNGLAVTLQQILAEVSDDPAVPVALDQEVVAVLAEQLAARMPTAAQVAQAVNDDTAARLRN